MKTNTHFRNGWYVLYTRPKFERKIFEQLKGKVELFLPFKQELRQWSDRKKMISSPLFPSYVFVNAKNSEQYTKALEADGVCCYVSFGGRAAIVPDNEIKRIQFFIENFKDAQVLSSDLLIGERRKINHGPFAGYDCEIINHEGKEKVVVEIHSLQQKLVATLKTASFSTPSNIMYTRASVLDRIQYNV